MGNVLCCSSALLNPRVTPLNFSGGVRVWSLPDLWFGPFQKGLVPPNTLVRSFQSNSFRDIMVYPMSITNHCVASWGHLLWGTPVGAPPRSLGESGAQRRSHLLWKEDGKSFALGLSACLKATKVCLCCRFASLHADSVGSHPYTP